MIINFDHPKTSKMKIFSWVHRQFLHKVAKKDDDDKVPLLDQNEAFSGACDGWNEGILSIGTMGADLCQDFKSKEDTFMNNDQVLFFNDDDDGDHDDEMERPLVRKYVEKHILSQCDEVAKHDKHVQKYVAVKDLMKIRSEARITLADLLRVDSERNLFKSYHKLSDDHKIKSHYNNEDDYNKNNNNTGTESIKSLFISKGKKKFAKDDSAPPIKKAKQLMKKVLRKKIHPNTRMITCEEMDVHAT